MKKKLGLFLGIALAAAILFACAPKVAPETPVVEKPVSLAAEEGWKAQWDNTLKEAKKESVVTIASSRAAEVRQGLTQAFKEKYGIEVLWVVGRPAELEQKIITERRQGLYSVDLILLGGNNGITLKNLLQSIKAALILPEVKDEKAWLGGKFPFIDSEGEYVFASTLYPQDPYSINTDLLPNYREELASYYDLLKPKWKGKIVSQDFIRVGGGLKWFSAMIEGDFGPILNLDFMKALVKQEPLIILETRQQAEWMIRGKYPLGLNLPIDTQLQAWKREGIRVPVEGFTPKEGGYLTAGGQVFLFLKNAPHTNAVKIFLNWVFSREGQILLSYLTLKHSTRIDIPEPGEIDPNIKARDPKLNYVKADQEKYLLKTGEYAEIAKEIFAPLYR